MKESAPINFADLISEVIRTEQKFSIANTDDKFELTKTLNDLKAQLLSMSIQIKNLENIVENKKESKDILDQYVMLAQGNKSLYYKSSENANKNKIKKEVPVFNYLDYQFKTRLYAGLLLNFEDVFEKEKYIFKIFNKISSLFYVKREADLCKKKFSKFINISRNLDVLPKLEKRELIEDYSMIEKKYYRFSELCDVLKINKSLFSKKTLSKYIKVNDFIRVSKVKYQLKYLLERNV